MKTPLELIFNEQTGNLPMLKQGVSKEKDLDLCEFVRTCNPDENELEDFCALNYEACEKYMEYSKENTDERRLKNGKRI